MADQRANALQYAHTNKENFLNTFKEILAIPSISTDKTHLPDIQRAAEWLAMQLRTLGMEKVQLFPTSQSPIIYGECLNVPGAPTILFTVITTFSLWIRSIYGRLLLFEPTVIGDNIFARGASDMKGQAVITLKAVESLVQTGGMPINIKWLFEGEEEVGSPNLENFISVMAIFWPAILQSIRIRA